MKRKLLTLTLALLASLMLVLPASAAEYGVIYTEAEALYSAELEVLGQDHLPWFTETYGIDLRVDVLTSIGDFASLEKAAAIIYDTYEYGYGEGRNGVTLTLLVHEDEDGVALDEWYVHAAGDSDELTTNGPWNVYSELDEIMTEENWSGGAEQDTKALEAAVVGMRDGVSKFVLAGGVADSIWSPVSNESDLPPETLSDAPDQFPALGEPIGYVTDTAGILTADERQELEQTAQAVSEKYDFGVYIMTVDSFVDATDSYDVDDAAVTLYQKYDLGLGDEQKGVLLLLSMKGRDFSIVTYSDYGNYVFDSMAREETAYSFLDNFQYDEWYAGFNDYLASCNAVLADGPDKVQSEISAMIGMIFLFPLIIAVVVVSILGRRMKSVFKATEAEAYAGGLELTRSHDQFTHSTETRRKRKEESSGSGGGSIRSSSSGGFGRTSGKF